MSLLPRSSAVSAVVLLLTTHSLPAPISEIPESPRPALEEQARPKKSKPKATDSESESPTRSKSRATVTSAPAPALQGAARFSGVWSGRINQGLAGHVASTLTVSEDATSVELSHKLGGGKRSVTTNGGTISWRSGILGEVGWTLAPNSDGQTAKVTMKGVILNDTQTFRRGTAPTTSESSSTTPEKTPANSPSRAIPKGSGDSVVIMGKSGPGSMTGPRPEYPEEARTSHLSGRGTFVLHFDIATGNVIDVTVSQSTGSAVLDQSAIATFRQWHATPNGPKEVPMTTSFGQTGSQ